MSGRVVTLLEVDGQRRLGQWDDHYRCFVSVIQPNLRLRPVAVMDAD